MEKRFNDIKVKDKHHSCHSKQTSLTGTFVSLKKMQFESNAQKLEGGPIFIDKGVCVKKYKMKMYM